ncbi:hypothetical protein PO81_13460 [Vibrio parahaemolyticus]|nr:hypothetical protein PO81_13460 [Vibrio parahaemolyticus]
MVVFNLFKWLTRLFIFVVVLKPHLKIASLFALTKIIFLRNSQQLSVNTRFAKISKAYEKKC